MPNQSEKKSAVKKKFVKKTVVKKTKKVPVGQKIIRKSNPDILATFVVDTSGSMLDRCGGDVENVDDSFDFLEGPSRLDVAKDSLRDILNAFKKRNRPGDRVEIILFDERVRTILKSTCPRDIKDVDGLVDSIKIGGTTAFYDALKAAVESFPKSNSYKGKTLNIFALTDGMDTCSETTLEEACALVQNPGRPGLKIRLVSVGISSTEAKALDRLAEASTTTHEPLEDKGVAIKAAFTTFRKSLFRLSTEITTTTKTVLVGGGGRSFGHKGGRTFRHKAATAKKCRPATSGGGDKPRHKTAICKFWAKGHCTKGTDCAFAHGAHEIRTKRRTKRRPVFECSVCKNVFSTKATFQTHLTESKHRT